MDTEKLFDQKKLPDLEAQIGEAFADRMFVRRLSAADTPEEARAVLLEKNIDLSLDDVRRLPAELERMRGKGDELSEDELEEVAGGMTYPVMGRIVSQAVIQAASMVLGHIRGW